MLFLVLLLPQCILSFRLFKSQRNTNLKFTVLGDWGSPDRESESSDGGQLLTATSIKIKSKYHSSQFVVSVGDNFYVGGNYSYDGILSVNDTKWNSLWREVYTDHLSKIPWYSVMGNHDWYGKPEAQIEYSKMNPNSTWKLSDFFYEQVFTEASTAFIFIDTNLLHYGYNGDLEGNRPAMKENFLRLGWTRENHTVTKQLKWIQSSLSRHQDKKYIFVVGHHPLGTCPDQEKSSMPRLKRLLKQYRVTAYLFGHHHALQYVKEKDTMFIQVGSSSKKEPICENNSGWGHGDSFGYALGKVTSSEFRVSFYNENDAMLEMFTNKPRYVL